MARWRPPSVRVSRITLRFGSPALTRKIERPPMPSSGLSTHSPCSATKARSAAGSRLTRVGGQHCGNSSAASFSFRSRRPLRVVDHQHALGLRPATGSCCRAGTRHRPAGRCASAPRPSPPAAPSRASPSVNQSAGSSRTDSGAMRAIGASAGDAQAAREHVMQPMAAALGLEQHGEGGVLGDLDGPDRVHHHGDVQRHVVSACSILPAS